MAPRQSSAAGDRFFAFATTIGIVLGLLYLGTAFMHRANLVPGLIERLVPALAFMAGGAALGWIGARISMLLLRMNDLSRQFSAAANDHVADFRQIADRLEALASAQPAPEPGRATPPAAAVPPVEEAAADPDALPEPLPMPVPEPQPPGAAIPPTPGSAPAPGEPALYDGIIVLLEEIREAALMGDEDRRARLQQLREARLRAGLERVFASARAGEWAAADEFLAALESQFPGDAAVRQARDRFDRQRADAEPDALFQTEQRVRDLVQANAWERAGATATQFVNNFPTSSDGRRLLSELRREHDAWLEGAFHRLYEQVQSNIERRLWRAALREAQRLLEQFPHHARAGRVRQQLQTLAANAEIEERQEQEVRIQLLVKNQRFAEAVELAEEVIRRFPNSPQADALEARLPQLRELADLAEGNGI